MAKVGVEHDDPLQDAAQKMKVASLYLGKGIYKDDHDAACRILDAMSVPNSLHSNNAAGARRLALAALWYADAAVRNLIAVVATSKRQ